MPHAPTFVVGKDLAEGRLLMPDYQPTESELSVIYPPGKNLSVKVRSLIDSPAVHFGPEPPRGTWRVPERTKESGAKR
jgi:DNA-binding transcriptional LysR family regulator